MEDVYSDIDCSCSANDECVHKIPFTKEERDMVYQGLRELFPDIPEKDLRLYIYGEPQEKSELQK